MISSKELTQKSEEQTGSPVWSTKLSFVFGLCALLGILLLIFSEVGFAQPAGGFKPGGAAIGSPMNDPGLDDDDFEEFDDDLDNAAPTRGATKPAARANANKFGGAGGMGSDSGMGGGGISIGGKRDDTPGPELKRSHRGFELTGPGTEKGIQSKNNTPDMPVDTESGDGVPANSEMITDFNFPDADIMDIAKTLGRLTGKNFVLDKEVKGRVTIISNSPITVSDAWRAFLTTLDMNNLAIVPTGKFLRIMRQNDAKGKNVRLYSSTRAPNTDALVTKIFKIKYISAKELENVIRTYANMGARIYGFEQTNTLIITDTGSNIDKIAKMIQFLDVEGFDAGIEVVQVKYASAVELSKLIDNLLPGTQANFSNRPGGFGAAAGGGGRGANFASRRTKEGGLVNTIIPDEHTNTLIVNANPKGVEQVRELVTRLDRKQPPTAGGGKVHVVYLQFADSEDLAKTLTNFTQNAKSPAAGGGFGSFPGGGSGLGVNPNEGSLFEGSIKISADKTTNSLVVTASPTDYETLFHVINKLDIPRDQIYVEMVIMEMAMQKNADFAANVITPGSGISVAPTNDLFNLITNPSTPPTGLVLQFQSAAKTNYTITPPGGTQTTIPVPNLAALLKALQTYSKSNVLSTPQLMTLDNTEATFESTDKIPVPQVNNAGLGIQTTSINYQSVPLSIKIKPQLNKVSNFIKLDIKAKVSNISNRSLPKGVQDLAYATLDRSAETSVMVADSDTIVLGGLSRDNDQETINKVPFLGDIPILGWLFKSKSTTVEKTNLLIFITPHIIKQPSDVRAVLDRKLKERDEFVEKSMGGEDGQKDERNKIIRELPDVKDITNYNTNRALNLDAEDGGTRHASARNSAPDTLTLPAADQVPNPNQPAAPQTAPQAVPVDAVPAPGVNP